MSTDYNNHNDLIVLVANADVNWWDKAKVDCGTRFPLSVHPYRLSVSKWQVEGYLTLWMCSILITICHFIYYSLFHHKEGKYHSAFLNF